MYSKNRQGWFKHIDFIILDLLCMYAAFAAAYLIRYKAWFFYAGEGYRDMIVIMTLVNLLVCVFFSSMKDVLKRSLGREFLMTLRHVALVALAVTFCLFSARISARYSRIFFYIMVMLYFILSLASRLAWKGVLEKKALTAKTSVFLVTSLKNAEEAVRFLLDNSHNACMLTGLAFVDCDMRGKEYLGCPILGYREDIAECLREEWVDEVYISLPTSVQCPEGLEDSLVEMGIVVHIRLEDSSAGAGHRRTLEQFGGETVLTTSLNYATVWQAFVKRTMDIAGGIAGCLATGILCIVLGPMIYLSSPGPIFFTQTRVGRNGKKFKMYKFRTMCVDAEKKKEELVHQYGAEGQMMFKLEWDPRIIGTKQLPDGTMKKGLGNYMREWSLDEFPQFFNVLKGDMSLVGTRPPTVDEWEKYEAHHRARLAVRPGITGLWQVSGRSEITDFEEVVELDRKYICEWSLGLDLKILAKTVKVVMRQEGAM